MSDNRRTNGYEPDERWLNRTSSASFSLRNRTQRELALYCEAHGIKSLSKFVNDLLDEKLGI